MADIKTYKSTLTGKELDDALRNVGKVTQSVEQAAGYAAQAKNYADSIDPDRFATAVAYTVTVPTSGWTSGSLSWGGTAYTRRCTVYTSQATSNPTTVMMEYAGGDYDAYCTVALIDTQNGSVVLWANSTPSATCQIKITEVRG